VDRTGRNIAAFSGAISCAAAAHRQRHLSIENDVRGLNSVGMLGVTPIRPILPDVGVTKALAMQLLLEFGNVHL